MISYRKKVVIAGMLGNSLEFCDFAIFSFFAPIISSLFFPASNPIASLLAGLMAYAVGFVMRPIGGILFGYIGDKYGRKSALVFSISLMSIGTLMIGLLPTYEVIGILAPISLVICRMLQGISTGGEYNGSVIYVLEHYTKSKRGLAVGLIYASSYIGFVFASIISILSSYIPHTQYWRVPFLFGFVVGCVGLYIRSKLHESPEFTEIVEKNKDNILQKTSLEMIIKNYKRPIIRSLFAAGVTGVFSILTLTYVSTHLITFSHWPKQQAMFVVTLSSLLSAVLSPIYGYFADRIKVEKLMLIGIFLSILIAYPFLNALNMGEFWSVLVWQLLWVVCTMLYMTPMNLFITHQFEVKLRYLGSASSYSIGMALFGGTTPIILTALTHNGYCPSGIFAWIFIICFLGILSITNFYKLHITENETHDKKIQTT